MNQDPTSVIVRLACFQQYFRHAPAHAGYPKPCSKPSVPVPVALLQALLPAWPHWYMGSCQNCGPLLGPLNTRCCIRLKNPKGTIILTTTHIVGCCTQASRIPSLILGHMILPRKPVAQNCANCGLLSINIIGLLWVMVACCFGPLGLPGMAMGAESWLSSGWLLGL